MVAAAAPAPDSSFDGLDFANWGQGHPPDTNGDVGPNYYIETINVSIGIYDKSNGNRVAAFTFNTFMSQGHFGNLCDTDNFGDPVVLYDSYEDRWVITDFAFKLDGSGNVNPPARLPVLRRLEDRRPGQRRLELLLDRGARRPRRLPEVRRLAGRHLHVGQHVRLRRGRVVHRASTCGRSTSSRCTTATPSPQVVDFAGRHVRLHGHPGERPAADGHAAGGLAGVLRLDRAVPERALDLQVPRRLGQDLDLDVHRARRRSSRRPAGRTRRRPTRRRRRTRPTCSRSARWRRRSTRTSAAPSRSGSTTPCSAGERHELDLQRDDRRQRHRPLVPGERHRRHRRRERRPGRRPSTRTPRTRSSASCRRSRSTAAATWRSATRSRTRPRTRRSSTRAAWPATRSTRSARPSRR